MSVREKTKKRKYRVFFSPEENTVGSAPTSKIVDGVIAEENEVTIKWDNKEVAARFYGSYSTSLKS